MKGPKGAGRDEEKHHYWANRATSDSRDRIARHRQDLTNGKPTADLDPPRVVPPADVKLRDTAKAPDRRDDPREDREG